MFPNLFPPPTSPKHIVNLIQAFILFSFSMSTSSLLCTLVLISWCKYKHHHHNIHDTTNNNLKNLFQFQHDGLHVLLRPRSKYQQSWRGERLQVILPRGPGGAALLVGPVPRDETREKVSDNLLIYYWLWDVIVRCFYINKFLWNKHVYIVTSADRSPRFSLEVWS